MDKDAIMKAELTNSLFAWQVVFKNGSTKVFTAKTLVDVLNHIDNNSAITSIVNLGSASVLL